MTIAEALAQASRRLAGAGIADPMRDARKILTHVTGGLVDAEGTLTESQATDFSAKIDERARFRPVSQIIGFREFWGRRFKITSQVLDPRPDTETLIETALDGTIPGRILDLGTGSGVLAITLLKEFAAARATATDISANAVAIAAENAESHGVADRLMLLESDWFANIDGKFDLIVSNPPYVTATEMAALAPDVLNWEPHIALTPGGDGLGAYRKIAAGLADFLAPQGRVLLEIGAMQSTEVSAILRATGLGPVTRHLDLNGHVRVIGLQRPAK